MKPARLTASFKKKKSVLWEKVGAVEEETSHCGVMKGPKDAKHAEDRQGGMEQRLPTAYRVTLCDRKTRCMASRVKWAL